MFTFLFAINAAAITVFPNPVVADKIPIEFSNNLDTACSCSVLNVPEKFKDKGFPGFVLS